MSPQQEQALAQQAQTGDREALGALWDALTPKLFGYLINVTRDRALAEDLLQTTWLHAINALPRFQPRGAGIRAWLFAIARNECRQHWRKSKREATFTDLAALERDQAGGHGSQGNYGNRRAGGRDNPQAGDERDTLQNKLLVEQILNLLSEDDRELLRLRYIADLSLNDIARVLNINFVAVRVRIHRALARARTAIIFKNHEH